MNALKAVEIAKIFTHLPDEAMIDIKAVTLITGISRSVWYKGIKTGIYPRQVRTSKGSVRWIVGEIRLILRELKFDR